MTLKIFPTETPDTEFKQSELRCDNYVLKVKAKTDALQLIMHIYRATKSLSEYKVKKQKSTALRHFIVHPV